VAELEVACGRLAARLNDRPDDRVELLDIATVLAFSSRELAQSVAECKLVYGPTKRVLVMQLALQTIDRQLRFLREGSATVSLEDLVRTTRLVLRLVEDVVVVLNRQQGEPLAPNAYPS
jgi:hypothetical protein